MNSVKVVPFDFDEDLLGQFIELPWKIYHSDNNWVPPTRETIRSQLSPSYPFFRHGKARKFIAYDAAGEVCGRVAAIINDNLVADGGKIGHVGFFECIDRFEVARALLDQACGYMQLNGIGRIWGPINYATLYSYRLLTKGFDRPSFYTDIYNPPYYPSYFRAYGFREIKKYYSDISMAQVEVAESYSSARKRLAKAGCTIRPIDMDRFDDELTLLYRLMLEIFKDNFAFSLMDYDEFYAIYGHYKKLLKPEHWRIAHGPRGQPIGFFLAFPDFSGRYAKTYICKMLGVLPEFRRYGTGGGLVYDALNHYIAAGYETAIASLRIEGNLSMNYGVGRYSPLKEYALFQYDILADGEKRQDAD